MHGRMSSVFINKIFLLIMGLCLFFSLSAAQAQVHLVIDVSGNIQRLDPSKQRIKAIHSFINQLPEGSYAGIWTYAGSVNYLVPAGVVNEAWRHKARQAVNNISGYGSYSNVEAALAQATYYWRDDKPRKGRNVILLTDSGLRVSENSAENQAVKDKLLKNLLPAMERSGVKIHVLAFDKADAALYQELTAATSGSYQTVASPAALPSAFKSLSHQMESPPARPAQATVATEPAKPLEKVKKQAAKKAEAVTVATRIEQPELPVEVETTQVDNSPQEILVEVKPESVTVETTQASAKTNTDPTPANTEIVTAQPAVEAATAAPKEAAVASAETLGAQEAEEIRTALANAEAELSELLTEFAALPKTENSTTSKVLNGQESTEPLVITLADGSVLVTPNEHKAHVATQNSNLVTETIPVMAENAPAEETISTDEKVEWPGTNDEVDIWPLILTILVVVNLVVIFLLFVGRFLWLRHKRKKSEKSNSMF